MYIFNKIALQGLRRNRTRTFVTIMGVALSAAMITAMVTFAVSLQNYMINGAAAKTGGWHIAFADASPGFARQQAQDERVAKIISYENIGYAVLEEGKNEDKPYLFIAGFGAEALEALPVRLLSGRLPENASEAVVSAHIASNGGVKISVGDTLTLAVGERRDGDRRLHQHDPCRAGAEELTGTTERTYTVVGICQRPVFEERSAPGYTLITAAGNDGKAESLSIFVTLKNPYRLSAYEKDMAGRNDIVLNDDVLRFMGLSGNQVFNAMLCSVGVILLLLIVLGSVFMIYNSFRISLNERVWQFGIFLSVGATEKQLRKSVLFEGLCIGAIGIPAGILIGLPGIRLVLFLVEENFENVMYDNVPLTLTVSIPALAAAAAVAMVTILISAWIPAKKAASMSVMECIRRTEEVNVPAGRERGVGLAGLLFGLEGMLALKNFRRDRRRYRSTILSLTLSVVLFVTAGSFAAYLKEGSENAVVTVDYDICFYAREMEEEELRGLYDILKTVDGVYDSGYVAGEGSVEGDSYPVLIFRSHNPGQSAAQMQALIDGMSVTAGYTLHNFHEMLETNRNMLFIINLFTAVFTAMITLIAVANVFNTVSTNIMLRRRELAMVRSVGMSDRDFCRMMNCECVFYGLRTLLISIPLAGFCSWLVYMGMFAGSGAEDAAGIRFLFPWTNIGISLCGVFLVIFITTLYTVNRIKKENIIDALRDDMA